MISTYRVRIAVVLYDFMISEFWLINQVPALNDWIV